MRVPVDVLQVVGRLKDDGDVFAAQVARAAPELRDRVAALLESQGSEPPPPPEDFAGTVPQDFSGRSGNRFESCRRESIA